MGVIKATKKPVTIEAIQWTGDNLFDVITFLEGGKPSLKTVVELDNWSKYQERVDRDGYLGIQTLEGLMKASVDDYIILGVKGELYPCKPDIFMLSYDIEN